MERGRRLGDSGSAWLFWVLALASAACSGKGSDSASGDSNTANTTGAPATPSTTTAATVAGSGGPSTSSVGASTASSSTSAATTGGSGGSATGGSGGVDAGSMGGLAGADTTGDTTTGHTGETVEGDVCSFTLSHTTSTAIGTVQIVSWSTDLPNVTDARIEFGLTGSDLDMSAPVDLEEPDHRTLLLGMKGDKSYSFRIVASSEDETCTGPEISFMTGPVPDWVPTITKSGSGGGAAKGFVVTASGLTAHSDGGGGPASVFIFDTDGDVVWWTPAVLQDPTGVRMSWDGKTMYFVNAYVAVVFGVSMDGMTSWEIPELEGANHDLTVLPDGGIVAIVNTQNEPASIVELQANGSVVSIVSDLSTLYADDFHPNAIHYHPADDSFTLSDLYLSGFVKFTRAGELLWQLGGSNPLGNSFELLGLEPWGANHGHHLTSDGRFLLFNNNEGIAPPWGSRVFEVQLDETDWTATATWEYLGDGENGTAQFGDVERLPNGNVLVTYSNQGLIVEANPSGEAVQSFVNDLLPFGYASFRSSLYGPPPR